VIVKAERGARGNFTVKAISDNLESGKVIIQTIP